MMAQQVNLISRNFNFENCFAIDRNGNGGRFGLFWSLDVNVNITSYSSHHKDAVVHNDGGNVFRCTSVYGHSETRQKHHLDTIKKVS